MESRCFSFNEAPLSPLRVERGKRGGVCPREVEGPYLSAVVFLNLLQLALNVVEATLHFLLVRRVIFLLL